ncbi:NHL repeat-containing protein [Limisalsivibrio acetivorans]|uniref:NHL repeat-containing protein n=1 Tax=Limisalsivibrio acetivorans TaxID=1304888 RepID=UPI00041F58B7|nr:NHL repeat-containing protein [Limisalsivibrio acetivorans]
MRKTVLTAAALLFALSTYAADYSAKLIKTIELGEKSAPADAVFESNGLGVYDAFDGSYTVYSDNGKEQKATLERGGNCLVRQGDFYMLCADESLEILNSSLNTIASYTAGEKFDPTDAAPYEGSVYVPDNDNHSLIQFNLSTGEVVKSLGKYGRDRLNFWYPYSAAFDKKGLLHVSEVINTRVQKITADLRFYEFVGSWGIKAGEFYRPTGIALQGNNLFVADGFTGVIQYFDEDADFAGVLKDSSGNRLEFGSPTHIRIKGNSLAVVDPYEKKVHLFHLEVK